jgi:hypothetical protein
MTDNARRQRFNDDGSEHENDEAQSEAGREQIAMFGNGRHRCSKVRP